MTVEKSLQPSLPHFCYPSHIEYYYFKQQCFGLLRSKEFGIFCLLALFPYCFEKVHFTLCVCTLKYRKQREKSRGEVSSTYVPFQTTCRTCSAALTYLRFQHLPDDSLQWLQEHRLHFPAIQKLLLRTDFFPSFWTTFNNDIHSQCAGCLTFVSPRFRFPSLIPVSFHRYRTYLVGLHLLGYYLIGLLSSHSYCSLHRLLNPLGTK